MTEFKAALWKRTILPCRTVSVKTFYGTKESTEDGSLEVLLEMINEARSPKETSWRKNQGN